MLRHGQVMQNLNSRYVRSDVFLSPSDTFFSFPAASWSKSSSPFQKHDISPVALQ